MNLRVLAAVVSLATLTAFAPVPYLTKPKRPSSPGGLVGLWQITARGNPAPALKGFGKGGFGKGVAGTAITTILIEPGKWTFQTETAAGEISRRTPYFLKVGADARPATFDLRRREDDPLPYGKGIYRLEGDELKIAYRFTGERPASLDEAGPVRVVQFTLRRVKK